MLMEAGTDRGRKERRLGKRSSSQKQEACASGSGVIVMGDAETKGSPGQQVRTAEGSRHHIPLIFWMRDGGCQDGLTPHLGGKMVFIESKRAVPIGTEVKIRLAAAQDEDGGVPKMEVADGIVIWHCPLDDHFKNRKGFGVSLRAGWPQSGGSTETQ